MKITEQELKKIILEEIDKTLYEEGFFDTVSGFLKGGWDAASEWAIGAIAGRIIEYFGWDSKGFLAIVVRKSIANIDLDEWTKIISDEDKKRCFIISDNIMEGIIEALAQKVLNALTDSLESATTSVLSVMSKSPQGMLAKQALVPAAFGITKEAITNMVKNIPAIEKVENELATVICKEISKLSKKYFS